MSDSTTSSYYEKELPFRENDHGCHILTLTSRDRGGYGRVRVDGKLHYAHRYQWEKANGPVPDGLEILHQKGCARDCVRLSHLRADTHAVNMAQIKEDRKTYCAVGHELNQVNSYKFNSRTICKLCKSKVRAESAGREGV